MAFKSERIIKILAWMSAGHRLTTREMQRRLADDGENVHLRSIQRDIETLEKAGAPIVKVEDGAEHRYGLGRGGYVHLNASTPSTSLLSTHLLKTALPQFRALDDTTEVFSHELIASITLGEYQGATSISSADLDTIITCIVDKHWLRVTYKRTDNTFDIFPYRLIPYFGRLYVAAWNRKHAQYIVLAVDKVRHAESAPRIREVAPDFDLDIFMSNRFGIWDSPHVETIIIHASADIYHEIAPRRWHPSQCLTDLADGGVEIRLRTGISHELVSWILHWAPHLTVVKPKSLREEVRRRLEEALERIS